jgi:hypothetical protein
MKMMSAKCRKMFAGHDESSFAGGISFIAQAPRVASRWAHKVNVVVASKGWRHKDRPLSARAHADDRPYWAVARSVKGDKPCIEGKSP